MSTASSRTGLIVALIAIGHAALVWFVRIPGLSWGEDDASYIQLADQIRQFSYREVHDVAQPFHARFPPGFPLILAGLRSVFSENVDAILALLALTTAASIVLLYDAVRRPFGERIAVAVAALSAISPSIVFDGSHVMAETFFRFWIVLGIWALARETQDRGRRYTVVGGGAMIAAALTRSAGIVFLPALVLYWGWQRKWHRIAWFSVGSLPVVAWTLWTFVAPGATERRLYTAQLGLRGDLNAAAESPLVHLLLRIPRRAWLLASDHVPTALQFFTVPNTALDNGMWAMLLVGLGATGMVLFWTKWRVASVVFVSYAALLLAYTISIPRFVHPVIPLILTTMLVGVAWWARRIRPAGALETPAVLVVAVALAAGPLTGIVESIRAAKACDRNDPIGSGTCFRPDDTAYLRLARWVRDSTPATAVFLVSKERAFYYHSGRKTVNGDRALREDSATIGAHLRRVGVTHAIVTRVGVFERRHNNLVARACREFDSVTSVDSRAILLQVRAVPAETTDTPTCAALQPWRSGRSADRP